MIVVSGEALMDVFDAGPTPSGQRLDARIGGSPLNVAVGLARLGQPVAYFGGLSRGFLGERLAQILAQMKQEPASATAMPGGSGPSAAG